MTEMGQQTRNYAELAGRTQAVVGDVIMALISMGISSKDLDVSNYYNFEIINYNLQF